MPKTIQNLSHDQTISGTSNASHGLILDAKKGSSRPPLSLSLYRYRFVCL